MKKQSDIIKELKNFWGLENFTFEAQYAVNKRGNGFFRSLRKQTDKSKIFLPNGSILTVGVPKELKLEEDKNYSISVFVPNDDVRAKFENDYTILLDTKKSPPKPIESKPETYVKSLESEYKSVIGIGLDSLRGAIKRISYDINRKPETFIFELIQNADDYPLEKNGRVAVNFKIVGDYLIFQHNGLPFGANNVRALCSVDAGDKEFDFEKIGYKGIGFKSIFKHSNYVLVHSGGYTFKFDEQYHLSKGIDTFWQLIPLWTELSELPQNVQEQISDKFNVTIVIKPEEGINQLNEYEKTFNSIFKDERVLLFLRHVEHFSFRGPTRNIIKRKDLNSWAVSKLNAIDVPIELQQKINDRIKVDDRIPQKYVDIEKTILTFASQKVNGKIIPTEQAHLYAYLPTDLDFGFPFLLNGDFIPDGGRQYLHADLEWNQFLLINAGKSLLKWIASLWIELKDFSVYSMLPDEKKIGTERLGSEMEILLQCFLNGISLDKDSTKFILDNNERLCSANEIIIDETGLFSKAIFNQEVFSQISNSTKKLPHLKIKTSILSTKYLEIEKFTAKDLIELLNEDENKVELKDYILQLSFEQYYRFIIWLDSFCNLNEIDEEWFLALPIIRFKESIISLAEALSKSDFYFSISRTKELEPLLTKIGFTITEFSLDDEKVKHIKSGIFMQDFYLKTDLKLYKYISAAKDLSKLSAKEKNTLISFFESLDEVGTARYANSLALFKSKKKDAALKPLNNLISNRCVGIPEWLSDFVIDVPEENALSISFKGHLLKEQDLLKKLFSNANSFNEITANINAENIEDFYAYLLKLHQDIPEGTTIDISSIPCVFIENNSTFALASEIFWPESIAKLSSVQYNSVKSIFETISDKLLPHHAALQIKAPFALGGKDLKLAEITPKENSFDVIAVNDFLDWAETNGENDLLNHLSFTKVEDKFFISKSNDTLAYYTTDDTLISFIEASTDLNSKLTLFPAELYNRDRNKLGLLEGIPLLKYLIQQNGIATSAFAKFIQGANDDQLSLQYLDLLPELNIENAKLYTTEDAEFKILKLVVQHLVDDDAKLSSFKNKILLDNHFLTEKAFSDDVRFYKEGSAPIEIKTKLKEILPAYQNQTYSISDIISKFINFRDDPKLIKIFKSDSRPPSRIYKELNELKPLYFSPIQTFFLSYYKTLNPNEDVFKDKVLFTNANSDNQTQLLIESHEFLNICLKESSYIGFVAQGIIPSFNPINLVSTEEYATDVEKLPLWLSEWVNKSDSENKKVYLKSLGINDEASNIVLYRKAIIEAHAELMSKYCALVENDFSLINTLTWLSIKANTANFVVKKEVLQPLYLKLCNRGIQTENLLFPCLQKYKVDSYSLQSLEEDDVLHFINEAWGDYKQSIFSSLITSEKITDDVVSKTYRVAWKVIEKAVVKLPDIENLKIKSYHFDEEYYKNWDLKGQYNIQIFKGNELPYVIKYNDSSLVNISAGVAAFIGNVFYIVESLKDNLFTFLAQIPEFKDLQSLRAQKQLYEERKESEKGKVKFTEQELEALKKLFGDEIPPSFHKDLNVAALVTGLIYLNNKGFDITEAETNLKESHEKAQLFPVFSADKTKSYTVMSRSAKAGLLYMTARAWNRLDDIDTWLFVTTGKNETEQYLFKNKQDVLNKSVTDFQVFRVESESKQENIDDIISGRFDLGKIWLIFKMADNKSYNSIFGDGSGIRKNEEHPDYDNINISENSPY